MIRYTGYKLINVCIGICMKIIRIHTLVFFTQISKSKLCILILLNILGEIISILGIDTLDIIVLQ